MSSTQKKLAAKVLDCGIEKVWIDPKNEKVSQAITRGDIRSFIKDGVIKKKADKKRSKNSPKKQQRQGSVKGSSGARMGKKNEWLKKIRPQRKMIKELKEKNLLNPGVYRVLYLKVKGGMFRSKAHLQLYLNDKKLLKEEK